MIKAVRSARATSASLTKRRATRKVHRPTRARSSAELAMITRVTATLDFLDSCLPYTRAVPQCELRTGTLVASTLKTAVELAPGQRADGMRIPCIPVVSCANCDCSASEPASVGTPAAVLGLLAARGADHDRHCSIRSTHAVLSEL